MSDTSEVDLRRVILQTLESWNAAGISHLTAVAVAPQESVSEPAVAVRQQPVDPAPISTRPEVDRSPPDEPELTPDSSTESNPSMARKSAPKPAETKKKEWFEVEEDSPAESKGPVYPDLNKAERVAELQILSDKVAKCTRCEELASTRTQTVFGVGNPQAKVVFIGEAPGADEDAQGEPFVGRAGQLLNKIIEAMKLKREEIYICNILRCRPPDNRLPAPDEACNCREYLDGQLGIINPEYIVCWGSCAAQNLLGSTDSIGKMRKRFFKYGNARVLCTYHPSYLLRNPAAKKDVWEDMQILMKELGIPVS